MSFFSIALFEARVAWTLTATASASDSFLLSRGFLAIETEKRRCGRGMELVAKIRSEPIGSLGTRRRTKSRSYTVKTMKPMKEAKRLTGRDDDEKYEEEIFIQTSHPAAVVAPFSRDIEPNHRNLHEKH